MSPTAKRAFAISLLAFACLSILIWFWRKSVIHNHAKLAEEAIQGGLNTGDFVSARSALQGLAEPEARESKEREIRVAELQKALSVRDTALARVAVGEDGTTWIEPKLLEATDLVLAREAIQNRDFETFHKLSEKWKSSASIPAQWSLLSVDSLLARKEIQLALESLRSNHFSGQEEAMRLARLALLEAKEPWKAMATIDEGLKASPRNADLLSFRAQIEEAAGRLPDARLDYVSAVLAERKNPLFRDVLANFYLRTGDLSAAAETWRDAAEDTGLGIYAFKSWFWSLVGGVPLSKPLPQCHQNDWVNFIDSLRESKTNVFWTDAMESSLVSLRGMQKRPEVVWLRLLELIRRQDYKVAKNQLEAGFPRDAEHLFPNLALRLLANLSAMVGENPSLCLAGRERPPSNSDSHPFVIDFNHWADHSLGEAESKLFLSWLSKPESLSGTLLASGWPGAALITGKEIDFSPDNNPPSWLDYGYAKSILKRDGKKSARSWLESRPERTVAADLLLGELLLTTGEVAQGLNLLNKVASTVSPSGSRAAWTLALAELDRGNSKKAREIVNANSTLADSTQGKEILARASLAEGNRDETLKIYQELGDKSTDAMIYLSKEAFAAKDYEKARKWTGILARSYPEQPDFRKNLLKIEAAVNSKKP